MEIKEPKFNVGDKVITKKGHVGNVTRIDSYHFVEDEYWYDVSCDELEEVFYTEHYLDPYVEKPKTVWNLEKGDKYYCLSEYCRISEFIWDDTRFDKNVLEAGNAFLNKKEAENELERRKIETEMIRLGGYRTLDHNDETDVFFIDYNPIHEDVEINSLVPNNSSIQHQGIIYFDFYFDAKEAINKIGKDRIKKYIFGAEE